MFGFVTRDYLDAALNRQFRRVFSVLRRMELQAMTGQTDFASAMSALSARLASLQGDMRAQVDAAVAAQKAKDDAQNAEDRAAADKQFTDAAAALTGMIDSLPAHVDSASQAPAGGDAPASAGTDASAGTSAAGGASVATDAGTAVQP